MRREPTMEELGHAEVVHEAEAQRQYPRVRLPGRLLVQDKSKEESFRLHDISAGGLSFDAEGAHFKVGDSIAGRLELTVMPVSFAIKVRCEVRNVKGDRVGCQFVELGPGEISALRRLIHGTLAGELVATGDVITALSRDNFVKARDLSRAGSGLTGTARARALLMTALMFSLGLIAFVYAVDKLYEMAFVTRAAAAKIAAPTFVINMPRDGTFFSLVPDDNLVKKGQPVASFQAAMLDVIQGDIGNLKLSAADVSQLMGEQLKGTLSSPCDCIVQTRNALDGQYVNRGAPLFELVQADAEPYVLARFHFDNIDKLPVGRGVTFRIYGESDLRFGKVRDVRLLPPSSQIAESGATDVRGLNNAGTTADVIASIEPAEGIERQFIDRPVDVTLSRPLVLEAVSSSFMARIGSTLFDRMRGAATSAVRDQPEPARAERQPGESEPAEADAAAFTASPEDGAGQSEQSDPAEQVEPVAPTEPKPAQRRRSEKQPAARD